MPDAAAGEQEGSAHRAIGPDDLARIARLRSGDPDAIEELRSLLGHAAHREAHRRAELMGLRDRHIIAELADDARDDAVVAVLGALERFEGRSRFTTWAWKFAVNIAGVAVRKHMWREREIPTSDEALESLAHDPQSPHEAAERGQMMGALRAAMDELTPRRREVLVALTVSGVPIDVLAERMGTTRGAVYKILHDARRALRRSLSLSGFSLEEAL